MKSDSILLRSRIYLFFARFLLAFVILMVARSFIPFIWQFFDRETSVKISEFFDRNKLFATALIGAISLAFGAVRALIDYKKDKDREELRKTNPEKAKELDLEELKDATMPVLKDLKREQERVKRRDAFYESMPAPVRDFRDATDTFLNGQIPKHRQKAVIIIAAVTFVIACVVVYILYG